MHTEDLEGKVIPERSEAEAQRPPLPPPHPPRPRPTYLAIDDGGQAEVVKDLGAVAPHSHRAIFAQALIIEAVDLGDLAALVIAPDQSDAVWVSNLGQDQARTGSSHSLPLNPPKSWGHIHQPHSVLLRSLT